MAQLPIRVISLRRSQDRRDAMTEHLGKLGLAFTFFDAFDGASLSEAFIASFKPAMRNGRPVRPAVLALTAGYKALTEEIAAGPDEFVCVLEDDARLLPGAESFFDPRQLARLPDFDVLRLGFSRAERKSGQARIGMIAGIPIVAAICQGLVTSGQIFSRKGARTVAQSLIPMTGAIDRQLFAEGRLPLRVVHPPASLVGAKGFGSLIRPKLPPSPLDVQRQRPDQTAVDAALREAERCARRNYRAVWGVRMYVRARLFDVAGRLHLHPR